MIRPAFRLHAIAIAFAASTLGCAADMGASSSSSPPRNPRGGSPYDGGSSAPPPRSDSCATSPGADFDRDGVPNGIDCNDCSRNVGPGAFDIPGNGIDEDCNGNDATLAELDCDTGLSMTPTRAEDAARAIGLCRFVNAADPGWGVLSARFTTPDGLGVPASMSQVGLLPSFGTVTPPRGGAMLALSSGIARAPGQPEYTDRCDYFGVDPDAWGGPPAGGGLPPGFVATSPSCPGFQVQRIYNAIALEVQVRAPANAHGFSFVSNFYTTEYPNFICDEFNDYFVALRDVGGSWQNIVFDTAGNPVSVNNGLLQACEPGHHGGKSFACPLGRAQLAATGFDGTAQCGQEGPEGYGDPYGPPSDGPVGAATGWLRTIAPVQPGEVLTLRFAIWDASDPDLDSLVLIDDFRWELDESSGAPTEEAPPPPTNETEPELF